MKQYILLPDEIMNYLQDDFEGISTLFHITGAAILRISRCRFCCPCPTVCLEQAAGWS